MLRPPDRCLLVGELNQLDAPYGGDLDARMKFSLDVLQAIRDRTGPDFLVGVRYTADDLHPGSIDEQTGIEIGHRLKASGLVDFLNVIRGRVDSEPNLTDVIPLGGTPAAPHLDFAGRIKAEVGLPTFHAARIADVATARHAVAEGKLDLVGMTRAHIADPHIVAKITAGREDEIRPCVGATYCIDRVYVSGGAFCVHNPHTGRELTHPHATPPAAAQGGGRRRRPRRARGRAHRRRGGPCGNRAGSRRSARRPGPPAGPGPPGGNDRDHRLAHGAMRGAWRHLPVQLLRRGRGRDGALPDLVVIATGGLPHTEVIAGADLALSAWDVLSGDAKPSGSVLIYDEAGDHAALQAAEKLVAHGCTVEIMNRERGLSAEILGMNFVPYMRALQDKGVTFTVARRLDALTRDGNGLRATIGTEYSDWTTEGHYDAVLVNAGTTPMDELYFELKPLSRNRGEVSIDALVAAKGDPFPQRHPEAAFDLVRIGDAVAARNIHAAIFEAMRILRLT